MKTPYSHTVDTAAHKLFTQWCRKISHAINNVSGKKELEMSWKLTVHKSNGYTIKGTKVIDDDDEPSGYWIDIGMGQK